MQKIVIRLISLICTARYRLLKRNIQFGRNTIANHKLKISGPGKVIFGDNVNLWAFAEPTQFQTFSPDAVIRIGDNTRMNGSTVQAREQIQIGRDCLIGSAIIMDNDFHHITPHLRKAKSHIPTKPVNIEDNVWLAGQSVVLKGVTIGTNSVIGFRSVVTKEIPSNVVAAGNPAKTIKTLQSDESMRK